MKKKNFVAVISDEARGKSCHLYRKFAVNFLNARRLGQDGKLHLTLKFLGETEENQLLKINETVEKIGKHISKFTLEISETGVFPSARNARILWLDVKDETRSLTKINDFLETECEKIGFPKENRNYKSHLTVPDCASRRNLKELAESHLRKEFEPVRFEARRLRFTKADFTDRLDLYKSSSSKFKVQS